EAPAHERAAAFLDDGDCGLRERDGRHAAGGLRVPDAPVGVELASDGPRSRLQVDDSLSPTSPLGDSIDVFVRRQDAQRFIEEIRGDEPELAKPLRIEERELEAGGRNWRREGVAKLAAPTSTAARGRLRVRLGVSG